VAEVAGHLLVDEQRVEHGLLSGLNDRFVEGARLGALGRFMLL